MVGQEIAQIIITTLLVEDFLQEGTKSTFEKVEQNIPLRIILFNFKLFL
jgi:hypothetical protein